MPGSLIIFEVIILLVFCKDTNFCTVQVDLDPACSKLTIRYLLQRVRSDYISGVPVVFREKLGFRRRLSVDL